MSADRKHLIKDHLNHTREQLLEIVGQTSPVRGQALDGEANDAAPRYSRDRTNEHG
jgi:hypothetical protein